mmetsp:Transcript_1677/g.3512  ORF Transcript_1677/g.3512 Transcript_1677/m.3512 type:complete len:218 (+) Transcript_1677:359-1012(+)
MILYASYDRPDDLLTTSGRALASGEPFLSSSGLTSCQCPIMGSLDVCSTVPGIFISTRAASSSEVLTTREEFVGNDVGFAMVCAGVIVFPGSNWAAGLLPMASLLNAATGVTSLELEIGGEPFLLLAVIVTCEDFPLPSSLFWEEIAAAAVLAKMSIISLESIPCCATDVVDEGLTVDATPELLAKLSPLMRPTPAFRRASRTVALVVFGFTLAPMR